MYASAFSLYCCIPHIRQLHIYISRRIVTCLGQSCFEQRSACRLWSFTKESIHSFRAVGGCLFEPRQIETAIQQLENKTGIWIELSPSSPQSWPIQCFPQSLKYSNHTKSHTRHSGSTYWRLLSKNYKKDLWGGTVICIIFKKKKTKLLKH